MIDDDQIYNLKIRTDYLDKSAWHFYDFISKKNFKTVSHSYLAMHMDDEFVVGQSVDSVGEHFIFVFVFSYKIVLCFVYLCFKNSL